MGRNWTEAQSNAIYARGGTLLVRAAAGSGKTAVLVERVVSMITAAEDAISADRLLVATFSNAAAAEMRGRISERIEDILREDETNNYLRKQQMLLESAQIGTVHAFCLKLIRDNTEKLGLPSDVRIADEAEMFQLRQDVLEEYLNEKYENASENFLFLVELLSDGRSDRKLKETVFKLYDFMRSHPFYEKWLNGVLEFYNEDIPVSENVWGRVVLDYAVTVLSYLLSLAEDSAGLCAEDEKLNKAYSDCFISASTVIKRMLTEAKNKNWDALVKELNEYDLPALKAVRGCENEYLKNQLKKNKDVIADTLKELSAKQFCANSQEFREDIAELRPLVAELFAMTLEYDRLLQKKKQACLLMDFSDMEQYALSLLYDETADGYKLSEIAEECAQKYDAIFVDEYQDTNAAQDMIFKAVSKDEKNIFMVGDVKQSIYRFRQAMPEIFISKQERFSPFAKGEYPANIVLSKNFRSMPAVLNATNYVFEKLMSKEIGEMEYDGEERLIADENKPKEGAEHLDSVDFTLIETNDESDLNRSYKEASYIAGEIKRMIAEGFVVFDREGPRKVEQRDFAVLLRSKSGRAEHYVKAFTKAGLSVNAEGSGDFFSLPEVSLVLSMLKVLDNPLSDIALTAVLMSEMFGFEPSDMARIRMAKSRTPLFACMSILAGQGDEKCVAALKMISGLRLVAATLSTDVLIRRIYDVTDLLSVMAGEDNGAERTSNLLRLIKIAAEYESRSSAGLGGFLRYVERIREDGIGAKQSAAASGGNSVSIMTIHASKGLEFPVVFVPENSKNFNKMDMREKTLLHSKLGFGCIRRNRANGTQFTTVPHEALKLAHEAEMMSEELRVLYVAMTRARDKLIMTAAMDNVQKKIEAAALGLKEDTIFPYLVRKAGSVAEWMMRVLLLHPDGKPLRDKVEGFNLPISPDKGGSRWKVKTVSFSEEAEEEETELEAAPSDKEVVEKIKERAKQSYKYDYAVSIPNKMSVSELSHSEHKRDFGRIPAFERDNALTPAQRGTALHTFMQFADYALAEKDPQAELERLVTYGYITAAQRDAVDVEHIAAFFSSRLYDRMRAADEMHREFKFLYNEKASELGFEGDDTVTIQGIADCVFAENGHLVVVDYKTDRVKTGAELVERYRKQLELYAKVLAQSFDMPVGETVIYSLCLDSEITVAKNVGL
ncbi:MAG: helicase-exonuclease AddAB subunit AddA [Oscillospiraceae bacterium]|nr:helicase-exonuclease AddAB subunit AddA [Oscillospiraceae bacterium]